MLQPYRHYDGSSASTPVRPTEPPRTAVLLLTMFDATYFHMPLFKSGTVVQWGSKRETISHVVVRRSAILVHLVGLELPVDSDALTLAPSRFTLTRVA